MAARRPKFRGKAITIACTDKKQSEHFYERVLGAKRIPTDGYGCPWFKVGDMTLA